MLFGVPASPALARQVRDEGFIVLDFLLTPVRTGRGLGGSNQEGAAVPDGSGVEEAVEGVVGRFQVEQHLPDLGIIQLIRRRHPAERLEPGRRRGGLHQRHAGIPKTVPVMVPAPWHSPLVDFLPPLEVGGQVAHAVHRLHQLP